MEHFLDNIYNNRPITMFGDGSMKRDYTYITDIINGILSCTKLDLNENEKNDFSNNEDEESLEEEWEPEQMQIEKKH